MRRATAGALAALSLTTALAGCASAGHRASTTGVNEWTDALTTATSAAASGRYDDADRTLDDYVQHHADTPEARETSYWRALFALDPANRAGSIGAAEERLADFLADSAGAPHRFQAEALRRIAIAFDSLRAAHRVGLASSNALRTAEVEQAQQRQQELQKEVQRLKDQLEKTTAELERIKKRLAKGP